MLVLGSCCVGRWEDRVSRLIDGESLVVEMMHVASSSSTGKLRKVEAGAGLGWSCVGSVARGASTNTGF